MTPLPARPPPHASLNGRAILVILVLVVSGGSGCLFPPVPEDPAPDTANGNAARPGAPHDPQRDLVRTGHQNATGQIEPAVRLSGQTIGDESVDVDFVLPPRLLSLRVALDWVDRDATGTNQTAPANDLDIAVVLRVQREEGSTDVWGPHRDDGGSPGQPDAPVVVESRPDDELNTEEETVLEVTVSPESSTGVDWVLRVTYTHLVRVS